MQGAIKTPISTYIFIASACCRIQTSIPGSLADSDIQANA
jgi:hypothetical protein